MLCLNLHATSNETKILFFFCITHYHRQRRSFQGNLLKVFEIEDYTVYTEHKAPQQHKCRWSPRWRGWIEVEMMSARNITQHFDRRDEKKKKTALETTPRQSLCSRSTHRAQLRDVAPQQLPLPTPPGTCCLFILSTLFKQYLQSLK